MGAPREIIDLCCDHGTDELLGRSIDYLVIQDAFQAWHDEQTKEEL